MNNTNPKAVTAQDALDQIARLTREFESHQKVIATAMELHIDAGQLHQRALDAYNAICKERGPRILQIKRQIDWFKEEIAELI